MASSEAKIDPKHVRRRYRGQWRWFLMAGVIATVVAGWWFGPSLGRLRATVLREQTIDVKGVPRNYRLVIPHSLDGRTPAPVLFVFHGALDTVEEAARYTQLDRLAASRGFYLVYPQGRFLSWPPSIPADNPEYIEPDLAMFDALCDDLGQRYPVDEKRVYVAGISQGAAMVNLLVARRSKRIAAAVSHSGWLPDPLADEGIHAQYKCPIMFIVGSADKQVPPATVEKAYTCFQQEGHPGEFHLIEGLGHRWALEYGINEQIWQFLSAHSLPERELQPVPKRQ